METFLRRNFKVKGNVLALYKPLDTQYTKLIEGIEVMLWHKAPMAKIFLGKGFTDSSGDFVVEFEADSPADYIVDGKITDVFIEAYYNGMKLEEPSAPDLLKGLVAYWKLDETTGTVATDATGNGHNGVLLGSVPPNWGPGKINDGLTFFGDSSGSTDSYVSVDSSDDFTFDTGDFTIALWVKMNNVVYDGVIIDTGGLSAGGIALQYSGSLNLIHGGGSYYTGSYTMTAGVWTHIVIRRIGHEAEIIVDNTSLGKATFAYKIVSIPSYPLIFSGDPLDTNLHFYDGMLDEIGIWKGHGLTDEEIALLYNNGSGRQYPF